MQSMFMFTCRAEIEKRVMFAGAERVWMMSSGMTSAPCPGTTLRLLLRYSVASEDPARSSPGPCPGTELTEKCELLHDSCTIHTRMLVFKAEQQGQQTHPRNQSTLTETHWLAITQ